MKLQLTIELDYDAETMHGDEKDAVDWFYNGILRGDNLLLHDNGDIGDTIGTVKVIEINSGRGGGV